MSNYKIIRNGYLAKKIVIVDGLAGCGKTLISPIVSAFDRVELLNYAFEIEFVCRLKKLKKISTDATISLIKMFTDHKLYQTMMGRETNFRYSDLSGVFNDSNPSRYFNRIFTEDNEMSIPDKIKNERPILNLTTHDLLSYSQPILQALANRLVYIEVVRHPLYMIIQQSLNMERLLDNPRDIQINFKYKNKQLPYFAKGWEDLFIKSNNIDKAIYYIFKSMKLSELTRNKINNSSFNNLITIPFEKFVFSPHIYLNKIEKKLGSKIIKRTLRTLKKQKVPRKKIADGIPLSIYKRCGWKPPKKNLTEKEELNVRRNYCLKQGASEQAMKKLDEILHHYEKKFCKNIFN